MSDLPTPPLKDLYVVDFVRHSGDLGLSVIVRANCKLGAQSEAFRLFPEHKWRDTSTQLLDYAQIDWETGSCFVMKRKKRPIPILTADRTIRRISTKNEEGT